MPSPEVQQSGNIGPEVSGQSPEHAEGGAEIDLEIQRIRATELHDKHALSHVIHAVIDGEIPIGADNPEIAKRVAENLAQKLDKNIEENSKDPFEIEGPTAEYAVLWCQKAAESEKYENREEAATLVDIDSAGKEYDSKEHVTDHDILHSAHLKNTVAYQVLMAKRQASIKHEYDLARMPSVHASETQMHVGSQAREVLPPGIHLKLENFNEQHTAAFAIESLRNNLADISDKPLEENRFLQQYNELAEKLNKNIDEGAQPIELSSDESSVVYGAMQGLARDTYRDKRFPAEERVGNPTGYFRESARYMVATWNGEDFTPRKDEPKSVRPNLMVLNGEKPDEVDTIQHHLKAA